MKPNTKFIALKDLKDRKWVVAVSSISSVVPATSSGWEGKVKVNLKTPFSGWGESQSREGITINEDEARKLLSILLD
ncbi:hypothetical protein ACIP1G_27140 [Pseudomonas sp. NPDC089392]|uniref:hypothetical protein n=1 Tax=Pseudomonas sp. NPDC089392 TaxID=3364459 RepID=UPI003804594C